MRKSKKVLNRKTKTRTKSKILPSGDLVEQTVITEVTETFSSPNCATETTNMVVNQLTVEYERNVDENDEKVTSQRKRNNKTKEEDYKKKGNEKIKGKSYMPFQTFGKT